jgi:peptide/nickel transport system substrate-binding protein
MVSPIVHGRKSTVLLLILIGLIGCQSSAIPFTSGGAAATPQPSLTPTLIPVVFTYPGEDWGYPSPFARYSRGPGYIRMSFLFDTLTWKDEDGVIPWLAKSWEMAEDGKTWTFELRPDVRWHDGQPFTAEDVAFTFAYVRENETEIVWSGEIAKVQEVQAIDEHTARFALSDPVAGPHFNLFGSIPIIPKHIWENIEDPVKYLAPEAVIGTGPFMLDVYSKEEGLYIYQKNPDFWGGTVQVDTLVFPKVQDTALALQAGEIDMTSFWGNEIAAVEQFEPDAEYTILVGPSFWVLQIVFNLERAPFDQIALRQAVAHAVDRQRIVDQVTHGGAVIANLGIVSPNTVWANPNLTGYAYDPDRARQMLQEAGLENQAVTIIQSGWDREAELIQADLEAIGLQVTVKAGDRTTVDGLLKEGNFDLAINGHGGIANPSTLRTPTWPAATYQNQAYDALFGAQSVEMDHEKRKEQIWALQEILAEDLPVLPLYHPLMWVVYEADARVVPFYTSEGIAGGIPIELNKLIFLER